MLLFFVQIFINYGKINDILICGRCMHQPAIAIVVVIILCIKLLITWYTFFS